MKVEITKAQIEAMRGLADDCSATIGQTECDERWTRFIRLIDRFLAKNNLPPREFK